MQKEIERKFLLKSFAKEIKVLEEKTVHQTYLSIKEDEELRVRMTVESGKSEYTLTHKKGSGMVRGETEMPICESMYYDLTDKFPGVPIIKTRKVIEVSGYLATLDFYGEEFDNLWVIEIEFPSEEEAFSFQAPAWFGHDVTRISAYKNKNLWKVLQKEKSQ